MNRTFLQQRKIRDVSDAPGEFNKDSDTTVPLVLVPDDRNCLSCMMSVPSGPYCILHRFGKDINEGELAAPGLQVTPSWNRIAYVVNAQACTYNAPIKSCPTADNVMVDCDLTLVFTIGPEPADVKKFVYKLGARRFDDFLFAASEEGIRHLIRSCAHMEVLELRDGGNDRVQDTLREMNKKFNPFGAHFMSAVITDVRFKEELQQTLQETTEFKSKVEEQHKRQKNLLDAIEYRKVREIEEQAKEHSRMIQDLRAKRTRVEIDRQKMKTDAIGRAEVAMTQVRQDASVAEQQAAAEKQVAGAQGAKRKQELLAETKARDQSTRIKVDQENLTMIFEAKQRVAAAVNVATALTVEAEAESKAAGPLKMKREHDLRMAKSEVYQLMGQNNKIVISGEQGEKLISEMLKESFGAMTVLS